MAPLTTVLLTLSSALLSLSAAVPLAAPEPTAVPEPMVKRAGAPSIQRTIPDSCTFTTALSAPPSSATASTVRYTPAATVSQLYSYYLPPDDSSVQGDTDDQLQLKCENTCFNYGNTWNFDAPDDHNTKCRGIYLAWDAVNPYANKTKKDAAVVKGSVECLLFARDLNRTDFETVKEKEGWRKGRAVNLGCPQKGS